MLSAYLDESGAHDGSKVLVLGCLVASPRSWEVLAKHWRSALDTVGVDEFHASDCAVGGGKFRDSEKRERDGLFVRLVNIIVKNASYRAWTAVSLEDHQQCAHYSEGVPSVYAIAALGCTSRVRAIALQRGADYRVPYVFDQGKVGRRAFRAFEKMAEQGRAGSLAMGAISRGDRREMPALQAADLFAYEMYRYISDQMNDSGRAMRRSLGALLPIRDAGGYFFGLQKLELLGRSVRRQMTADPDRQAVTNLPIDWLDKERTMKIARVDTASLLADLPE
jgi:hypothetical protein